MSSLCVSTGLHLYTPAVLDWYFCVVGIYGRESGRVYKDHCQNQNTYSQYWFKDHEGIVFDLGVCSRGHCSLSTHWIGPATVFNIWFRHFTYGKQTFMRLCSFSIDIFFLLFLKPICVIIAYLQKCSVLPFGVTETCFTIITFCHCILVPIRPLTSVWIDKDVFNVWLAFESQLS